MPASPALREIERLDPERDHARIAFLTLTMDFPWDSQRALEIALFRTYCAPSISGVLHKSGELVARPQKRYDDTEILISELVEYGYDSERGKRALRRMNQLHARFDIKNEDYLYVLSTFIYEPIRWIDRYGFRRTVDKERQALFRFFVEVGRRMGIRGLPNDYAAFERFNRDYEAKNFVFAESNRVIGRATTQLLSSWFPVGLRRGVPWCVYAMLDPRALAAFGFPSPPAWLRIAVQGTLKLRSVALRGLPRRRRPKLRSQVTRRSYPVGYEIEQLGPSSAVSGCPFRASDPPR